MAMGKQKSKCLHLSHFCLSVMFHTHQTFSYFNCLGLLVYILKLPGLLAWYHYLVSLFLFWRTLDSHLVQTVPLFFWKILLIQLSRSMSRSDKWYLFCNLASCITELDFFCTPLNHLSGQRRILTTKQRLALDLG